MTTTEENVYFRQGVEYLLIVAVLFVLSQLAGLAAIYVGAEYTTPSWNSTASRHPRCTDALRNQGSGIRNQDA